MMLSIFRRRPEMAHIIVEYSGNLAAGLDLQGLLRALHEAAAASGVFPLGGLRTRAYAATDYLIADGHPDNAFVHISLRVGHGRDLATRCHAGELIFAAAVRHLEALYASRPLGISCEMQEIDPVVTFKQNNLHDYLKRRGTKER